MFSVDLVTLLCVSSVQHHPLDHRGLYILCGGYPTSPPHLSRSRHLSDSPSLHPPLIRYSYSSRQIIVEYLFSIINLCTISICIFRWKTHYAKWLMIQFQWMCWTLKGVRSLIINTIFDNYSDIIQVKLETYKQIGKPRDLGQRSSTVQACSGQPQRFYGSRLPSSGEDSKIPKNENCS